MTNVIQYTRIIDNKKIRRKTMAVKKIIRKWTSLLLALILTYVTTALTVFADEVTDVKMGEGESSVVAEEKIVTVPAKTIKLYNNNKAMHKGDKYKIVYKLKPNNSDDIVTFKSYNTKVATVSKDGIVTAVGYGSAQIKCRTTSGKKVTFVARVIKNSSPIKDTETEATLVLLDEAAILKLNKTATISAQVTPASLASSLTYTSADTSIASVSASGKVTAVGVGSTYITVKASNGMSVNYYVTIYDKIVMGIDVSKWQGNINWSQVKKSGVGFAMIRSSYGNENQDPMLQNNVIGCEKYNIPYGFYHYTYAKTPDQARIEAEFFLNTIAGYNPSYPVVLDIEEEFYKKMSKDEVSAIITAFMDTVQSAGYNVMIYSYAKFLTDYVSPSVLNSYDIWVASWGDENKLKTYYTGNFCMWQYSSTGKVNGINGNVDLDYSYVDYGY